MKVLVTGAGAVLGQGIIRSLRASRLRAHIIAVDPNPLSAGLYWANTAYLIPMATAPDFMDHFRRVLEKERPDIILIGTDVELMILAQQRERLEAEYHTQIVVSSPHVISIADDKYDTYRFLRDNGFPHPDTCLPGEEQALIDRVGFPLIVKPRVGARSVGVHLVTSPEMLQRVMNNKVVIQECVGTPDDEYTAGVVHFNNTDTASIVMRRDLRDGNTYRAYVDDYSKLNSHVQKVGIALGGYGPINFQFRLSEDGIPKVFEINARFSGTTVLRTLVGFHEVEMVIRHILEGAPIVQPPIEKKIILRHWSDIVIDWAAVEKVKQA